MHPARIRVLNGLGKGRFIRQNGVIVSIADNRK